ncbi:phosphotransferase [Boudabousia marimammalium]|nr:phosphotransferase [Boudabousia marimammalium]
MNERNPLTLASLAVAALPHARIVGLRPPQYVTEDLEVTGVVDEEGNQYVVVAPRSSAAGASLEAQYALLMSLSHLHEKRELIVEVPVPVAMGRTRRNGDVMVQQKMSGVSMSDADLSNAALGASVGRAVASLHGVHPRNLDNAGMPVYSAAQIRARHRATVKSAQETGLLPRRLSMRWNRMLDDDELWEFRPCTVHGDMEAESFLIVGNVVMGMRDFSRAHVGDPAEDFAWALAGAEDAFFTRMLDSYLLAAPEGAGRLEDRAQLITELNLAKWLLSGQAAEDQEIISEATQMLRDLADQLDDSLDFESFTPVAGQPLEDDEDKVPGVPILRVVAEGDPADSAETMTEFTAEPSGVETSVETPAQESSDIPAVLPEPAQRPEPEATTEPAEPKKSAAQPDRKVNPDRVETDVLPTLPPQ